MIATCTCASAFQDKEHGKGQRVWNERYVGGSTTLKGYRCSVCGATKDVSGVVGKKK